MPPCMKHILLNNGVKLCEVGSYDGSGQTHHAAVLTMSYVFAETFSIGTGEELMSNLFQVTLNFWF